MSDNTSQKGRDDYRRELEREANRLEIEHTKAQSQFQEQQQSWHKKIQELDKDKTKIEERLRGFDAFVENLRSASREVDEEKVKVRKAKLEDELLDIKVKRSELVAQGEVDLRPYTERTQEAKKAWDRAKEASIGAKEYEDLLKDTGPAPKTEEAAPQG